jgi:hypothetical protein
MDSQGKLEGVTAIIALDGQDFMNCTAFSINDIHWDRRLAQKGKFLRTAKVFLSRHTPVQG